VRDVDRRGAETALELLELIAGRIAQLGVMPTARSGKEMFFATERCG